MRTNPIVSCPLFAAFVAGTVAAQIVPVTGGGNALATAVAQAPNGAILEVAPGSYSGFAFALSKNVTIVAASAPQPVTIVGTIDASTGSPQFTLRLVGLTFAQSAPGSGGEVWTLGNLSLEDCTCFGVTVTANAIRRRVFMSGCTVTAINGTGLMDVDAVIEDSTLQGGFCGAGFSLRGSLRAERVQALGSACPWGPVSGAVIDGTATAANCQFIGHPSIIYGGGFWAVDNTPPAALTVDAPVGSTHNQVVVRPLATAAWAARNWRVGGTSTVTYREYANELVVAVLSLDIVPWSTGYAEEGLWIGATPNWFVWNFGITNAQAAFTDSFTIPNSPALLYSSAWLTGVFLDPMPVPLPWALWTRTSVPIGGTIR